MTNARRDLAGIAREILYLAITERYEPTSAEMIEDFDITERQLELVKRHVKRYAADESLTWGYYPSLNRFVLDQGSSGRARAILDYGHEQVAHQVAGVVDQSRGAHAAGFLSARDYARATRNYRRMAKDLRRVAEACGSHDRDPQPPVLAA